MTEKQIKEMEKKVLGGKVRDLTVETNWIKDQLKKLQIEEQEMIAGWFLAKSAGEERKMQSASEALEKNRNIQECAEDRLKEIADDEVDQVI